MAGGVFLKRLSGPGQAWWAVAMLLAAGSLLAWWLPSPWLDWQPELAATEPWRAWTGAWVHWSPTHLLTNLGAAALVGAFGFAARVPAAAAAAWCVAWPLTQAGLLLRPELAHYGGLSGVMHAGVAVASLWLLATSKGEARGVGATVALGLLAKLWLEEPGGPVLRHGEEWDIATAPLAHATGAVAGALCAVAALAVSRWQQRVRP